MVNNNEELNDYEKMIESFTIFNKYIDATKKSNIYIGANHDEIYAGDTGVVTEEDKQRLEELGWSDYGNGSFEIFV